MSATATALVATIRVAPGKGASTKVSIEKHGEAKARALCLRWLRAKRLEQKAGYGRAG